MSGSEALVTAIVLCYNHSRFVTQALDSVKAQTYRNLQVLIFDDCSTDNSVEIIDRWIAENSFPCTFIRHDKNQRLCKTLNEAVSLSRGDYISLLATDDLWLPHKTTMQVELLENLPAKTGVAYTDAFQIDENGTVLPKRFMEDHRRSLTSPPKGDIHNILWQGNFIPAMSALVRAECYKTIGGYDENLAYEDWDFWLRVSQKYEFAFSPEISAKYRVLATSMIRTMQPQIRKSVTKIYLKHLAAGDLPPLAKRRAIDHLVDTAAESRHDSAIDYRTLSKKAMQLPGPGRPAAFAASVLIRLPNSLFNIGRVLWRWTFGRRYERSMRKKIKI